MASGEYDAADNSAKCYALALKEIRLNLIRAGKAMPRADHPEEIQAAREGCLIVVDPVAHRASS